MTACHFASLIEELRGRDTAVEYTGMSGTEREYAASIIGRHIHAPVVVVLPTMKAAQRFHSHLGFFMEGVSRPLLFYPQYNILPHKQIAYHNETAACRIAALYRLVTETPPPMIVTTVGALMKRILPRRELLDHADLVMAEEEIDREQLVERLVSGGYFESTIVEEPGDFSVRGGILDVFSPLYSDPVRIEFFGDMVDNIRLFDAASQRKRGDINEAVILPAREAIVKKEHVDRLIGNIRKRAGRLELPVTTTRKLVERVRQERMFSGIEGLLPCIYEQLDTFFDYAAGDCLYLCIEPGELERSAAGFWDNLASNYALTREAARFCVEPESLYLSWSSVQAKIAAHKPVALKTLQVADPRYDSGAPVRSRGLQASDNSDLCAELKRHRDRENPFSPFRDWISARERAGSRILMVCRTRSQMTRLRSLLDIYGVAPVPVAGLAEMDAHGASIFLCRGELDAGFDWPAASLAIVTAEEIFGIVRRTGKPLLPASPPGAEMRITFSDLKQGDLIVHDEHGIGQYEGLAKLKIDGATNDFLLILYRDEDKLYLPVDRMNRIQKYMGVDGVKPVLNKMGGKSWDRIKDRVKRSAEKIAGQLLKLYASRRVQQGHRFSRPDANFSDFESGFAYEETADQTQAINDVLRDMEAEMPMDRLVCGDVGYGKTEVALRAAFKAVNDCKQVAVVVPTTVLAEQHFSTFTERFEPYPIRIACLTRFRSGPEQRRIVAGLKEGTIDIVIGTHRLFQKDVGFRDIGLLIFDEEHRFGVKHKEKLKRLRKTVDVLALTATPIPRTLHLSLTGIRDISVISTPPEQRRAIITYVCEFDETIIVEAIRKELERDGQIFFIHNNIHSIQAMATKLKQIVPEVRLDVAHGRMDEDELEQAMLRFMNREIDMLVCTTIVESGLDIPSANSILINRADRLGLAQMYQLRGRVGRADEQAFAYLFIPPESHMSKDAQKRLKVLMEHSDLGAGFQIAMSDLKIRGGGTILGASQSGHIASVGYDMFLKLMEEAIAELKGESPAVPLEPEINISFSAFIPESYIPDIDQRLAAYRRLAKMTSSSEIAEFKAELMDRFGRMPAEAGNLLSKIVLKTLAAHAGIKRLDLIGNRLTLLLSPEHRTRWDAVVDLVQSGKLACQLTPDHVLSVQLPSGRRQNSMVATKNILKQIAQHGNA